MRAFATALDAIPLALAENSGLSPIDALADVKSRQITEKNSRLGIDCLGKGDNDMSKQMVVDPLISKRSQLLLATQVVRMILRVDDVIGESNRIRFVTMDELSLQMPLRSRVNRTIENSVIMYKNAESSSNLPPFLPLVLLLPNNMLTDSS